MSQLEKEQIKVCSSIDEFNELLSNARPKNSVVIAGMYNSLIDRILIGDGTNQGKKNLFLLNETLKSKLFFYL